MPILMENKLILKSPEEVRRLPCSTWFVFWSTHLKLNPITPIDTSTAAQSVTKAETPGANPISRL